MLRSLCEVVQEPTSSPGAPGRSAADVVPLRCHCHHQLDRARASPGGRGQPGAPGWGGGWEFWEMPNLRSPLSCLRGWRQAGRGCYWGPSGNGAVRGPAPAPPGALPGWDFWPRPKPLPSHRAVAGGVPGEAPGLCCWKRHPQPSFLGPRRARFSESGCSTGVSEGTRLDPRLSVTPQAKAGGREPLLAPAAERNRVHTGRWAATGQQGRPWHGMGVHSCREKPRAPRHLGSRVPSQGHLWRLPPRAGRVGDRETPAPARGRAVSWHWDRLATGTRREPASQLPASSSITCVRPHRRGSGKDRGLRPPRFPWGRPSSHLAAGRAAPAPVTAASVSSSKGGPRHPTPLGTWSLFARRVGRSRPPWVSRLGEGTACSSVGPGGREVAG